MRHLLRLFGYLQLYAFSEKLEGEWLPHGSTHLLHSASEAFCGSQGTSRALSADGFAERVILRLVDPTNALRKITSAFKLR